jgi:predicted dehydrogenase
MATNESIGIGLIGCGAFGAFCMEIFQQIDGVKAAAFADIRKDAAESLGREYNVTALGDPAELIALPDVNLVHVATPPSTHHELVLAALNAGKHVLCEKPLAMNVAQADEMLAAATAADCISPVNFVLRYNKVTDTVKAILDSGVLGRPLAARLTNCAADSNLGPGHWFWDKSVSGGIFIEHGVHFFDLYRYWFGEGEVVDSHVETHAATDRQSRVACTVRHDSGVIASHYHAFDQVGMMDRTGHRIICELGDLCIGGWIPLSIRIYAAIDSAGGKKLADLCGGAEFRTVETFEGQKAATSGRMIDRTIAKRVEMSYCPNTDKQTVYSQSARELMSDQIAFIRDRNHTRRVTEINGRDAVGLAEAAEKTASKGRA